MRTPPLLVVLLAVVVLPACTSAGEATTATTATAATTCSNGMPYTDATVFPDGDSTVLPPANECLLRCGDTSMGTWGAGGVSAPTVSALPTGACTVAGETCHLSAVQRFCPPAPQGSLLSFTCRCTDGQWSCSGHYESGGVHAGSCSDGGL